MQENPRDKTEAEKIYDSLPPYIPPEKTREQIEEERSHNPYANIPASEYEKHAGKLCAIAEEGLDYIVASADSIEELQSLMNTEHPNMEYRIFCNGDLSSLTKEKYDEMCRVCQGE